ncbi:fimbria/pilus periplasmic chaperone [Burkholderia gladioli]|uniref:fimbria/pilus periplasmic chaperone n=1 Tax=Burkholderia gladioli TaxID=28095 RepID=UPI00163E5433|nr:fimbria/pilus periplasmic chaperone [Burkholderia gladioli]
MKYRKALRFAITAVCAAWLSHLAAPAEASVVISGTRVIYDASETEVTIKLSNDGELPVLVQSWVDAGDAQAAPSTIKVPFVVTPPISRIDPRKSQTLRIVHTGELLPEDHESAFWLDVLEVPPKPKAEEADTNRIQLAFHSRIKLFYRPSHLKGAPADAPAQLAWRLVRVDGKPALEARNPTPYYVSVIGITLQSGGRKAGAEDSGMVAPGGSHVFPLSGDAIEAADASVHYVTLNDYGASVDGVAPLQSNGTAP